MSKVDVPRLAKAVTGSGKLPPPDRKRRDARKRADRSDRPSKWALAQRAIRPVARPHVLEYAQHGLAVGREMLCKPTELFPQVKKPAPIFVHNRRQARAMGMRRRPWRGEHPYDG